MLSLLNLAAKYSISKNKDERVFFLGAVGVRQDGRIVHSKNAAVFDTSFLDGATSPPYKRFPGSHAEIRLSKKLGFNATVYVARVKKGTGELAMARPCECCQAVLRSFRVDKVFYTISDNQWGVWDVKKNTDFYYFR